MPNGGGQKGIRDYDWAFLVVEADDVPDHQTQTAMSVLLVRRHRYTRTLSYYRCFSPTPVTLARLVSLVCRRWRVEEDFQAAKETCALDKGRSPAGTPGTAGARWPWSPTPSSPSPSNAAATPMKPTSSRSPATNSCVCCGRCFCPHRDATSSTRCGGPRGADAINTTPAPATADGTPTRTQHHDPTRRQTPLSTAAVGDDGRRPRAGS